MLFTTLLAPLALLALPFTEAKYKPKTHNVIVGGAAGLVYTPHYVYAQPGDYVKFSFQFKNHTVTQSSFDYPCEPLKGGFTSGFKPVAQNAKKSPTFKVKVKNTHPIWVHCEQIDHCPSGMVFAINPPRRGNTFWKFLENAKASDDEEEYDDYRKRSEINGEAEEVSDIEARDVEENDIEIRDIISRITGKRSDASVDSESEE